MQSKYLIRFTKLVSLISVIEVTLVLDLALPAARGWRVCDSFSKSLWWTSVATEGPVVTEPASDGDNGRDLSAPAIGWLPAFGFDF